MKKSESVQAPLDYVKKFMQHTAEGAGLGTVVVAGLTPLFNWTNCSIGGKKFIWKNGMTGWKEYVGAVGPVTAVSYAANYLFTTALQQHDEPLHDWQKILSSSAAGAIAGMMNTPAELIAQTKQYMEVKATTKTVVWEICAKNGVSALWRGNGSIMTREASWATVYMSAVPIMSAKCHSMGCNKLVSDMIAATVIGGAFGFFSTPMNVLRFEKQGGLLEKKPNESYYSIAKRNGVHGLFRGLKPRMICTVVAAGAFTAGRELLEYGKQTLKYT